MSAAPEVTEDVTLAPPDRAVAHIQSPEDEHRAICGARVRGTPARPGEGRCAVCLDLATDLRFER